MQQDTNIVQQTRLTYDGSDYYLTVTLRRSGRINIDVIPRIAGPSPGIDEARLEVYRTIVELLTKMIDVEIAEVQDGC